MFNSERFHFEILSVLSMSFGASTRYSPARKHNALIFRKSGTAEVVHEQESYSLTKNDVAFIRKGYDYTITTTTEEEVIIVHFDADVKNGADFIRFNAKRPELFRSLFESLLLVWTQKPLGFVYKLDALFSSVLEQIERQTTETYAGLLELSIQRAIDEMHLQFSNPDFSIEKLAAFTGYTPSYFRRAFKRFTGKSPVEYLISIRIEHAASLLSSGYYTVEQVATACGFESSKYFSTFFKTHTGTSPSKVIYKAYQ